jgi:hypothetical protein
MTETESKWAARVAAWRASGQTAPEFCEGKDFKPGGLRYWASQLRKGKDASSTRDERVARVPQAAQPPAAATEAAPPEQVRLARVVRAARPAPAPETAVVIEVGAARLAVRRGFDREVLRAVLEALGGGR